MSARTHLTPSVAERPLPQDHEPDYEKIWLPAPEASPNPSDEPLVDIGPSVPADKGGWAVLHQPRARSASSKAVRMTTCSGSRGPTTSSTRYSCPPICRTTRARVRIWIELAAGWRTCVTDHPHGHLPAGAGCGLSPGTEDLGTVEFGAQFDYLAWIGSDADRTVNLAVALGTHPTAVDSPNDYKKTLPAVLAGLVKQASKQAIDDDLLWITPIDSRARNRSRAKPPGQ